MKPSRTITILKLCSLAFLSSGIALAEPDTAVKVDVFAQHTGGKIAYQYRVFNNSQRNITAVVIGHDTLNDENPGNDIYELYEMPSGWNAKFGIPSTSSNAPTGWRVNLTKPEGGDTHAIIWEPLNLNTPRLTGGQTLTKMRIAIDQADSNYLTGHARITFTEGNPLNLTVPIERLDNTPPSFTVNLTPGILQSPNDKLIAVKATFEIKDDYDRMPDIKLESITANEDLKPGDISDASIGTDDRYLLLRAIQNSDAARIYTAIYSATDASGNQTTTSAAVTVTTSVAASAPAVTPTVVPIPVTKLAPAPQTQTIIKKPDGKN